jgi:hypothetical protein
MKKYPVHIFVMASFLSFADFLFAQCSDAGVCQFGSLSEHEEEKDIKVSLEYTNGYSGKDEKVSFNTISLSAQYRIWAGSELNIQFPYNLISGPRGDVNGAGDLIASWTQNIFTGESSVLNATLGAKFSTGDENKAPDLPQIYQPGLGSNDIIFAIDYLYDRLGFGFGYQIAGGRNEKEGIRLKRGDDLLVRALYKFNLNQVSIIPQLMFIKRLSESSILDQNSAGETFIDIDQSDQAQLNLVLQIQYPVSEELSLFMEGAAPFLKREVNIDGLTRAYTVSAGVRFTY